MSKQLDNGAQVPFSALTAFQKFKTGYRMPITWSQLPWAPPRDKNLTTSSKCLSPSPFLLFSSQTSYITNHVGLAYAGLLCPGCNDTLVALSSGLEGSAT